MPAFDDYADALRGLATQRIDPLQYVGEDGTGTEPFKGTFGHFDSHKAINVPMSPPNADYVGDLPITQQPKVTVPDPWADSYGNNS